jgi:hypothetical protein
MATGGTPNPAGGESSKSATGGIALTVHQLLRYSCGGILFWLVAAVADPEGTQRVTESLGYVGLGIAALSVGTLTYVLSRVLIVHVFLICFRWEEKIWFFVEPKWKWSRRNFFEQWVAPAYSNDAWRVVRDNDVINERVREQIHLQHSENHIPYIVTFVCLASAIGILLLHVPQDNYDLGRLLLALLMIGQASFVVGLFNDANMAYHEGALLYSLSPDVQQKIVACLARSNLPKRAEPDPAQEQGRLQEREWWMTRVAYAGITTMTVLFLIEAALLLTLSLFSP